MAALALIRLMARRDCFYGLSMRSPPLAFLIAFLRSPLFTLSAERGRRQSRGDHRQRWCVGVAKKKPSKWMVKTEAAVQQQP